MGKDRPSLHGLRSGRRLRGGRRAAPAAGALIAVALLVAMLDPASPASAPTSVSAGVHYPQVKGVPDPIEPAFTVPDPNPYPKGRHAARWAPLARPVVARLLPHIGSPGVARLQATTPEGTTNIVLTLRRTADHSGRLWVEVMLPVRPNGTTGWVPRDALGGYGVVRTELVVDLSDFEATLYRRGRAVFTATVGIGKPSWPTPVGHFYIRNKLAGFDDPFYGPVAFGTSARSAMLTDWPAGGFVGIHGTDRPGILPGRVSHGCIRMRNGAILRLSRLMPAGTPLTVQP